MTDTPRNPLVTSLLETIRTARRLREEGLALREALSVAIETIGRLQKEVKQARAQNLHLRAELRAFVSGRTIGSERQELERQSLESVAA